MNRKFRRLVAAGILALGWLSSSPAGAAGDTLYDALGGQEGLTKIVNLLLKKSLADDRIKHTFAESNIPRVEKLIVEQLCHLTGGPCVYKGQPMDKSHKALKLNTMHFNAMVEDLQDALDELGVPFRTQNRLLALLAPMKPDIVTR